MTQRVGVMGGTFDPVHLGHINLAKTAYNKLQLDKVLLVPVNYPWLKKPSRLTQTNHRTKMIEMIIENYSWLELSKIDILRGGKTYTVDTLKELKAKLDFRTKLFLILGSDSINDLSKWKQHQKIYNLSKIVVGQRPKFEINRDSYKNIVVLNSDMLNISSSIIRENIKRNVTTQGMIPLKIKRYICNNRLYGEG